VPGAFRVTALIDQVLHLLPLGARGLRHTHPILKRRRRTLHEDRTRSLRVRVNPQDHQESAGRGRQTPSLVVDAQEALLVREGEALAALRRHTLVVTGVGHEPLRRTPHHDRVSLGSLIEASGSPFRQALTHQSRQLERQRTIRRKDTPAPSGTACRRRLFPPVQRKNGGKTQLPVVGSTMRVMWVNPCAALAPPSWSCVGSGSGPRLVWCRRSSRDTESAEAPDPGYHGTTPRTSEELTVRRRSGAHPPPLSHPPARTPRQRAHC
jgi:hypothetical protein